MDLSIVIYLENLERLGADVPFFVHGNPRNWNSFGDVIENWIFNLMLIVPHFQTLKDKP